MISPRKKAGPLFRFGIFQANNLSPRFYRWSYSTDECRRPALAGARMMMEEATNYEEWSHESLIKRVTELERELKGRNTRCVSHLPYL